jgi:adenosylmethionine-8-amino-7-oxononanoate aminotransferase
VERGRGSKHLIISRWQSFHGATIAALGYGGHTFRRRRYLPLTKNDPHIPPAYRYRCEYCEHHTTCSLQCAKALEREVRRQGPENVAAFIAEPVVGAALGAVPAPEGYFEQIRKICDEYDVLFISDEVMTGLGRTGANFGIDHWGVVPDLIATAKGVSGGYTPLGVVIAKDEIIDVLERNNSNFVAGHTYVGNPLSSAIGLAVLRYMQKHRLFENARVQGEYLLAGLHGLMTRHSIIGDVRGKGLMGGLELVSDRKTKQPFRADSMVAPRVGDAALDAGLTTYALQGCVDGVEGDMIKVTPPLCITRSEVDELISILDSALSTVEREL